MTFRVVIEKRGVRDLDEASGWIAERSFEMAERWLSLIEAHIQSLAHFPERCPLARENGQFPYELRQLVYGRRHGRYRIIFTIRNATVHVLHVRHGAKSAMTSDEIDGLLPPKA